MTDVRKVTFLGVSLWCPQLVQGMEGMGMEDGLFWVLSKESAEGCAWLRADSTAGCNVEEFPQAWSFLLKIRGSVVGDFWR